MIETILGDKLTPKLLAAEIIDEGLMVHIILGKKHRLQVDGYYNETANACFL